MRLTELALHEELEESWAYNPRTKRLIEIGAYETTQSVSNILPWRVYHQEFQPGDTFSEYHLHPFTPSLGIMLKLSHPIPKEECLRRFKTTNSVLSMPSHNDIKACHSFTEALAPHDTPVRCFIADYGGIMETVLTAQAHQQLRGPAKKGLLDRVDQLHISYYSLQMTFDEYREQMKQLGVNLHYRRLIDPNLLGVDVRQLRSPGQLFP